jgi:signal recognition particle receptor subunit beta
MPITNYTDKEVQFKVVLYGPPFGGKGTTMRYLHSKIEVETKGELTELKSAADKTLVFEFVPADATLLDDFKIRFEVFTVTGEIHFNAPRKLVLRDADGIIFVADSAWTRTEDNVQAFKNLEDNLKKLGATIDEIPTVLHYNKRDLADIAPVSYLDFLLNNHKTRMQTFETTASEGKGVFAGLRALSHMVIQRFLETSPGHPMGAELGMAMEG